MRHCTDCSPSFLLRIVLERIRVKTETKIADKQAGFRQGRGTGDQVRNIRILMHKAHEHRQSLYMCFVDFKKAFNSIPMISCGWLWLTWDILCTWLSCWTNYRKQLTKVRVAGTLSEWFRVKKGVRQSCVLSPCICSVAGHFGTKTLRHQDSSAPRNWCRSVRTLRHQFFWCRTVSWSLRTGAKVSLCLNTYKTAKDDKTIL